MTARTTQVYIRDRAFVLSELRNRAQRTCLVREKRALSKRTSDSADDLPRNVDRRMGYAFKNFCLQVGNVVASNQVNKVISVRFASFVLGACRNSARGVTGDNIGNTQDHEFHQRFAGRGAAGIYSRVIPTHDHWRRGQFTTRTLYIELREGLQ